MCVLKRASWLPRGILVHMLLWVRLGSNRSSFVAARVLATLVKNLGRGEQRYRTPFVEVNQLFSAADMVNVLVHEGCSEYHVDRQGLYHHVPHPIYGVTESGGEMYHGFDL